MNKEIVEKVEETNGNLSLVSLLLTLTGIAFVVSISIYDIYYTSDRDHRRSAVKSCDQTCIPLGELGHPSTPIPGYGIAARPFSRTLKDVPRTFKVSGCRLFKMPASATGVFAATAFPAPEFIYIQVGDWSKAGVQVCVEEDATFRLYLWVATE